MFYGLHRSCATTVLVKLVSPSKLVHHDDGSVIPSIHSLVREHFTMTARFRLLLSRTCSFLASHPASWIDVQSLPRGCHFLVPIHQVRTCTSHQQISCVAVNLQPAPPHTFVCFGLTDRTRRMMLERGAHSNWAKKLVSEPRLREGLSPFLGMGADCCKFGN